jgi:hypothetical protein
MSLIIYRCYIHFTVKEFGHLPFCSDKSTIYLFESTLGKKFLLQSLDGTFSHICNFLDIHRHCLLFTAKNGGLGGKIIRGVRTESVKKLVNCKTPPPSLISILYRLMDKQSQISAHLTI